ncbi:MAG: GAF domain-containing protein [Micromonosporaceae bacterium]
MTTGERCGRDELRELSAAVLAVTSRLSVREVLQTIVSAARRLLGARYAALGVPDDAGSFAEFVVDGVSDEQWRRIGPLPRQHGMLALLLRDPTPVRAPDIRAHPRFGWWPRHHPDLRDFLGMPIVHGDRILGALYLANKEAAGGFTADDEDLLRILAAHAAIALVNARLYERSRELSIVVGQSVPRLLPAREEAVYRVAQEALHNALRHAQPRTVEISLAADGGALTLEIRDDGKGFDPANVASLGLASMRDRARAAGGRLAVVSRPGRGTTVRLEVPVG